MRDSVFGRYLKCRIVSIVDAQIGAIYGLRDLSDVHEITGRSAMKRATGIQVFHCGMIRDRELGDIVKIVDNCFKKIINWFDSGMSNG